MANKIRQPIVSVVGHVDHGKTSILDCFRGSSIQEGEAGGITQKISFTKFPLEKVREVCPLIEKSGVKLDIPGFLFIDTPGHAAFTNLRKRGGSLADLAILVVSIKEGIKPQTAEVLQILKTYKTPFIIALNKADQISGWKYKGDVKNSIENLSINARQEFDEALMTFQGALSQQGFESDLYYEISDFTKKIGIVPCSAKNGEGISELLFVLSGLSEKFLKERLKVGEEAKGVVFEVKKGKGGGSVEAILYDGELVAGDEIVIGSFGEPVVSKVRALEEIAPLSNKYRSVSEVGAATGIKLHLTNKEGVLSGMPFQVLNDNLEELKKQFMKELGAAMKFDKQGIIVKADSLGSLEALLVLLKEAGVQVVRAGIGSIGKSDIISAKANMEINPLDSVIVGFNVEMDEGVESGNVKIFQDDVVYKLIEDLQEWRGKKRGEIEKEKLMSLSAVCKLEILKQYVFRNSNPAVFGVRVVGGKLKNGIHLIDNKGEEVGRVKGVQHDRESVEEATEGQEVAISVPGVNFERRLKEVDFLYADFGAKQFKNFKEHKDLLSESEKKVLVDMSEIKGFG